MLSKSGLFTYKCLANNTAGTANSTSVNITGGGKYDILSILQVYEALCIGPSSCYLLVIYVRAN